MDDERVVSRLRQVADPASPYLAFLERMYEELAEELRFRPAHQSGVRPSHSRMAKRLILLAAAAVLTLSIVGGALLVGAIVDRERRPTRPRLCSSGFARPASSGSPSDQTALR